MSLTLQGLYKILMCMLTVVSCQRQGHMRRLRHRATTSGVVCHTHSNEQITILQPTQIHSSFKNKLRNLQVDINLIIAHLACKFDSVHCSSIPLNAIMSSFPLLRQQIDSHQLVQTVKTSLTEAYYKMTNIENLLHRRVWRREYRILRQMSHTFSNDLHSFVCYINGAGYDTLATVPARFKTEEESVLLLYYVEVIKNLRDLLTEIATVIQ